MQNCKIKEVTHYKKRILIAIGKKTFSFGCFVTFATSLAPQKVRRRKELLDFHRNCDERLLLINNQKTEDATQSKHPQMMMC
jgi:hypothetical protein